jgi:hypothetical protein
MLKCGLLFLAALYIAAALIGHLQERLGAIRCEPGGLLCKRLGLSLFRWIVSVRAPLSDPALSRDIAYSDSPAASRASRLGPARTRPCGPATA